jgi:RNA polymerase sigma-70 factor (ECF subfamily)
MSPSLKAAAARTQAASIIPATLLDPAAAGAARAQTCPRPRPRKAATRSSQLEPMLYLRSPRVTENPLQFRDFDAAYIENLRAGDLRTQEHFAAYFTELLHLKLRSRLQSPHAIEDVSQETFARVLTSLRKEGALRRPECLGAFVNTVCNNVLFEHYRMSSRSQSLDEEGQPELPAADFDVVGMVAAKQLKAKVREILLDLPERDRSLLSAVFLEERDRDEVCRERGVDREYLRVLLHRAKQTFKTAYVKRLGEGLFQENA